MIDNRWQIIIKAQNPKIQHSKPHKRLSKHKNHQYFTDPASKHPTYISQIQPYTPKQLKKKQRKRSKLYNPIHMKTKDLQTETIAKTKTHFRTQLPYARQEWKERNKGKNAHLLFFQREKAQAQEITITTTTLLLNYIKSKVFTFNLLIE